MSWSGLLSWGLYAVLALFIYEVATALYHAFLDPLSQFPGPWYYAASPIPKLYLQSVRGTWHLRMRELHEEYGEIVRVSPKILSIEGQSVWKDVFGHKPTSQPEWPRFLNIFSLMPQEERSFMFYLKDEHRPIRRVLAPAFSDSALLEQEPIITSHINLLMTRLEEQNGKPLDISMWALFTTFDLIGDLSLGESFNCLENGTMHSWVDMALNFMLMFMKMRPFIEYPVLTPLLGLLVSKAQRRKDDEAKQLVFERTHARMARGADARLDFMTHFLRNGADKVMSEAELLTHARIFVLAGSETTATVLAGLVFYLLRTPRAHAKLVATLRDAFAAEDAITVAATAQLPYLAACVEEALRLYPPAELNERVSPGARVAGRWVPRGTNVYTPVWAQARHARYFRDPDAFAPERWLPKTHADFDPAYADDRLAVRQPFAAGPRNCIGRQLALAELRLLTARLLWRFDLALCPGSEGWMENQRLFTGWERGPLMITVRPRDTSKN